MGWNRAGVQTPASISSSRLQDRNFTQRGPRKSIEDDFMGKRRNCGVNEHLCFCTDANDMQQVTTRCIIAPFILKGFGRCCVRERHAPSLQAPARLQAGGTRFSAVPSPDHRSILPDRPENFPAFRHECKDDTVYILSWEQRGISNTIMGNISQDEIARIAENIFNMSLHVIC